MPDNTILYHHITQAVDQWRQSGYANSDYTTIADILRWVHAPAKNEFRLRWPQIQALETYWYLRLHQNTAHVLDLYHHYFLDEDDRRRALGISDKAWQASHQNLEMLIQNIQQDDAFVRRFKLNTLRETIILDYPSYILALAMGTGKTVIIGAIIATEFAMALANPGLDNTFIQNALVFAPGRTIIEALRELIRMDYKSVLPPHLYKQFAAAVKFTLTQDGQREIPLVQGSRFNVVVTNTEKIRIQREKIAKGQVGKLFTATQLDEARQEVANLRLQAIASLPDLAVFSDEAHHTYGQALGRDLKKVRRTVDYLAAQTNLRCVINTTGTPYFKKQLLHDVVIWYGLGQGIEDGILKEVAGNIRAYDFHTDDATESYVTHVVTDFFNDYLDVALPDGTPAKLAIYFPNTQELTQLRPAVESALAQLGLSPTLILEHHTRHENKADFDRFKLPQSPHQVALLVDRGVEGWDVPALFGCALVRQLKESNNFVLQAACRCLRQVPGNRMPARIYLSQENRAILEHQLQENYGETLADLDNARRRQKSLRNASTKVSKPPIKLVTKIPRLVSPVALSIPDSLIFPEPAAGRKLTEMTLDINDDILLEKADMAQHVMETEESIDLYTAAVELSMLYRLDLWALYRLLERTYAPERSLPSSHWRGIREQIERKNE